MEKRKIIGKKEGDWVNVALYVDNANVETPQEFMLSLREDLFGKNR